MDRRYSIGFLVGIVFLIGLFVFGFSFSYNRVTEKNQNEQTQIETNAHYFIRNKSGYITVYNSDGTIYEYTSILEKDLPDHIREKIDGGLRLNGLSEVYGFLENYSS